jgi:hypothetical protein
VHDAAAGSGHPYPGTSSVPSLSWIPGPGVTASGLREAAQGASCCSCAVMLRGDDHVTPLSVETMTYVSRALGFVNPVQVLYCARCRLNSMTTFPRTESHTGLMLKTDAFGELAVPKSVSTFTTIASGVQVAPPSSDRRKAMLCRPHTTSGGDEWLPLAVALLEARQSKSPHDAHRASAKLSTVDPIEMTCKWQCNKVRRGGD